MCRLIPKDNKKIEYDFFSLVTISKLKKFKNAVVASKLQKL